MSSHPNIDSTEEWRVIADFPKYRVSNLGRVASDQRWRGQVGRELVGGCNNNGYRIVTLCGPSGEKRKRTVHTLVATAFHGPRPTGLEVRHVDGDSLNNRADNLMWGSHSENMQDRSRHGTDHNSAKTHCPRDHEYSEKNTVVYRGGRFCLACRRIRNAAAYQARLDRATTTTAGAA